MLEHVKLVSSAKPRTESATVPRSMPWENVYGLVLISSMRASSGSITAMNSSGDSTAPWAALLLETMGSGICP